MKEEDIYKNIAKYYDYMLKINPQREKFFARVFQDNGVKTVLDCACGTGNDLVMFNSLGVKVTYLVEQTFLSVHQGQTGMSDLPIFLSRQGRALSLRLKMKKTLVLIPAFNAEKNTGLL